MKRFFLLLLSCSVLASCSDAQVRNTDSVSKKSKPKAGFAVVELFTSEGCSSCPAADKLMAELSKRYGNQSVLTLEMHVDYWDRLGWKDPFSQAMFSSRQNEYAAKRNTESIYTPQAVVNGVAQMVGSSEVKVVAAIDAALQTADATLIDLTVSKSSNSVSVDYSGEKLPSKTRMVVALVEVDANTDVPRGENSGRKLLHHNVILQMVYAKPRKGTQSFLLAENMAGKRLFVAALLQDANSGRILGFARSELD